MIQGTDFDRYAEEYDALLDAGLSITGENKNYYASKRLAFLAGQLRKLEVEPKIIMDFGCGTGTGIPFIFSELKADLLIGVDISEKSLEIAKHNYGSDRVKFRLLGEDNLDEKVDLVFCNGVFHHVPLEGRAPLIQHIHHVLRPGGLFALWENNPWNPGTRFIMGRCPLDQNAEMLTPKEVQHLLGAEGFQLLATNFLFIFPRALRWLRWIEYSASRIPIGGQYQVLAQKSKL